MNPKINLGSSWLASTPAAATTPVRNSAVRTSSARTSSARTSSAQIGSAAVRPRPVVMPSLVMPSVVLGRPAMSASAVPTVYFSGVDTYLGQARAFVPAGMDVRSTKIVVSADHRGFDAINSKFSTRLGPRSCSPPV